MTQADNLPVDVQKQHDDLAALEEFIDEAIVHLCTVDDEISGAHTIATELGFNMIARHLGGAGIHLGATKQGVLNAKAEIRRLLGMEGAGCNKGSE